MKVFRVGITKGEETEFLYFHNVALASNAFFDYMSEGYKVQFMVVEKPIEEIMMMEDVQYG